MAPKRRSDSPSSSPSNKFDNLHDGEVPQTEENPGPALMNYCSSGRKSRRLEARPDVVPMEATIITSPRKNTSSPKRTNESDRFIGQAVPLQDAMQRWPHRYHEKKKNREAASNLPERLTSVEVEYLQARCHYTKAEVDGHIAFDIGDEAYVKADEGEDNYICRIIEMFEALNGEKYFTAQWFYRAKDTVIKDHSHLIDNKRVFLSEIKDDNPLDCLVQKIKIVQVQPNLDLVAKKSSIPECDYYYDMMYLVPFSTFVIPPAVSSMDVSETSSISCEANLLDGQSVHGGETFIFRDPKPEMVLLDLYSGCGAMSTGLCLGAALGNVNLVTKWAVDFNKYACSSLELNHPETQVRNESAENFLALLMEWEKLCFKFSLIKSMYSGQEYIDPLETGENSESESDNENDKAKENNAPMFEYGSHVFEVSKILSICYGDPKDIKKLGLYLKVRWNGYGPDEDSWEPLDGLGDCTDSIKEFVVNGYKSRILPLPGDIDVICGGPPCQGVSGFNRFRMKENPLKDEKNKQLIVFMNFVEYLKPKYVLMENVVDIIKFSDGFLGRYALGRLVEMNYQSRMGMMVAGSYGLPQFRMRVFLWGARPTERLPQYPLPTHDVVRRGISPKEFDMNIVAHEEGQQVDLDTKLLLADAISDLPMVENNEHRDEMLYGGAPKTDFQRSIRVKKSEMNGCGEEDAYNRILYDHRPLELNTDDYQRVCQIPKKKGANFRDLPGVIVRNNRVEWDPNIERVLLPSGKPLIPDYAMTFVRGSSSKPFGRLWWDETVATVVTRAEPHNQVIIHPEQDRVLTIRENARLQGFPDYYKLCGPTKERYIQVGNAVAVPVARALGYALAIAASSSPPAAAAVDDNTPLFSLPLKFPTIIIPPTSSSEEDAN